MVLRYVPATAGLVLALLMTACGPDLRDGVAEEYAGLPEKIDFNFHVKPILSDRCYACHGPDAQNQQADLRLDNAAGAYAALASGNGFAIVPGNPGQSELIARINATDPEVVMPTPESNLSLSNQEIAILTKWVAQGAEYKAHWAFLPPQQPSVPRAGKDWARNEIDRFIAAKLAAEKVAPSPETAREYLVRRVFFDLNGLPPTVAEIEQWTADERPDWYEQLVDQLLARPAYGERMATYWLDVARFADTEGYLDDFHHELWPYRDWVIKAYNDNLPYDDFVEWQIGGDQFPNPTREQILATTFNRNHKQNSEGGIIPEEFRVEYVADRANTVGTAFMGLTVGCARCHDHKYDPFSQENYFQLFGFFNNTVERGDGIFALNAIEDGRKVANKYAMNAGPTLPLPTAETEQIYDHLQTLIEEKEAVLNLAMATSPAPASAPKKAQTARKLAEHTVHHLSFDAGRPTDASGNETLRDDAMKIPGLSGQAAQMGEGAVVVDGTPSRFERSDPFTVSFAIKTPTFFPAAMVLHNSNGRNQGYRGWDVTLDSNRVVLRLNHASPFQSITLRLPDPLPLDTWQHYTWSYDGSSRAAGMKVYRNGEGVPPEVIRDHLIRSTVPYTEQAPLLYERYTGLTVGGRHYEEDFAGGAVDELRVLNVAAGALLAQRIYCTDSGRGRRCQGGDTEQAIAEYSHLHRDPGAQALRQELQVLRKRAVETLDTVREVMVMGDDTRLRPTYILNRGVYDEHGKIVRPGVPENLLPWPEEVPYNRYGLAKWLTHDDHPLTARVAVNQMWYLMFGRGLVESVEDFGNQGALPSHPELLDWLAVDFRDNGWNVKRLVRQMVMTTTYRQSSVIRDDLQDRDPDNYWLARAPRYRRSAEMVRDNALAVSGLLNRKIGGRSVFPYQPPGLWAEVGNHGFSPAYQPATGNNRYRRSLYSFWKRNAPAPATLIFDGSLRSECQVRRQRSNTPLQALVLLNDPQTLEACRVLASRVLTSGEGPAAATETIFRTLTGRRPTNQEVILLTQFFEEELTYFHDHPLATQDFLSTGVHPTDLSPGAARVAALARVANTVMNSTEGYYKN